MNNSHNKPDNSAYLHHVLLWMHDECAWNVSIMHDQIKDNNKQSWNASKKEGNSAYEDQDNH